MKFITSLLVVAAAALIDATELVVITPGISGGGESAVSTLATACEAVAGRMGVRLLLREPNLNELEIKCLVQRLLPLCEHGNLVLHEKCAGARQIAAAHGVGLHLTSAADWPFERQQFSGPLGVSAHSEAEARHAQELGVQWAFLSPIARPTSKPGDARPPIGEAAFLQAQKDFPSIDLIALGGITPASAARLAAGGARGVAVLGGIFTAGESTRPDAMRRTADAYLAALG